MKGDLGPYVETDGPMVWVPRTVSYLKARQIAQQANENGDRLVYRGPVDRAALIGFARDCLCDEVCTRLADDDEAGRAPRDETCLVPAWSFELVER